MDKIVGQSSSCWLDPTFSSRNGRDVAVPHVHCFEDMRSLQPYRIPEANRKPFEIWRGPVPELVARFELSLRYRLPLWELVFRDRVVSR